MKKQRKLILSILTVFFLTLGVIGVTYGFSGEEEKAPTSKQVGERKLRRFRDRG
ncbi:hypothetical protein ACPJHQ_20915 [Rossellomorea sp. H39__3]